jgi:hypothetical protein
VKEIEDNMKIDTREDGGWMKLAQNRILLAVLFG